ncbi:MAG TPA: insulinase family protein [Gemmatimonadaceae bacterium]
MMRSTHDHAGARSLRPAALLVTLTAVVGTASAAVGSTARDAMSRRSVTVAAEIPAAAKGATRAVAPAAAVPLVPAGPFQDPALRTGVLPNGLRYYVRRNAMPLGRAELRLVVNAGSILEDDDQQGMAHFLEHMAFNGTQHFPHQSLVDFIESSGMRFGADLNAYTSYDETVYMLTIPTDEPRFLAQGLTVMEDWASGGIILDSAEVVAERGVVLGEWRSRLPDTTSQTIQRHQREVYFGAGARYLERLPIGLPELLERATRGPIARFYHDWYRPDLMAVVVVGDVDPAAVEHELHERFEKIAPREKPRARPASHVAVAAEGVVDVQRGPVTPSVQVLWPVPEPATEPRAYLEQHFVEQLLLQTLEQRFLRMRGLDSRPFVMAEVQRGALARPLDLVGVRMIAWPDSLERALATAVAEIERVAQHGIPSETLEREKAELIAQLEHAAASAAARPSRAYADEYTQHFLTGEGVLPSPAQELALARELLPALTSERIARAARFWRSARGRKVMFTLPELAHTRPPTRESVAAIFDSIANTKLAAPQLRTLAEGSLLEKQPAPGRVTKETADTAAGVTEWTLSNGARVLFKPSQNDPDELLLRAWSPGGFSRVPDSLFYGTGRMVARMMTDAAGLGTHDRDDLTAQLATSGVRDFQVDIGYGEESISLGGSPREMELLFQMMYLQFTAPRLDSAALVGWKNFAKYQSRSFSLFDQLDQIFARGNPRLLPVSTQLADLVNLGDALAVYHDRFGNAGDFTFTIVGAATAAQVKPLVERYLASLPATEVRETPKDLGVRPFLQRVVNTVRPFDIPKASTLLVFDGLFPTEPDAYLAERERLATLTGVLTRRLRTRLREELGATYSVMAMDRTYPLPKEHYQLLFSFDAAPERMRAMQREMRSILDAVRDSGATEAELSRTAAAQRRMLEVQLQDNDYWMRRIELFDRLGIPLDRIPNPYGNERLTPDALKAAATRYLPRKVYIQMTAMPQDSTLYTGAALDTVSADSVKGMR